MSGFVFVGGHLALDFLGTLKWRDSAPEEQLLGPDDLAEWVMSAGLVDRPPHVTDQELAAATELRESMYRVVTAHREARRVAPGDLLDVNTAAALPTPIPRLDKNGRLRVAGDVGSALSEVARSLLALLTGEDQVHQCARPGCTRLFIDRSRGGRRRWCGMTECGNRINAAAYRRRRGMGSSSQTG